MSANKYKYLIIFLLLGLNPNWIIAQNWEAKTTQILKNMGFEDIVVKENSEALHIFYTDKVFRGTSRGIFEILKTLLNDSDIENEIHLTIQENRISQITVIVSQDAMTDYKEKKLSLIEVLSTLQISYDTDKEDGLLKDIKRTNSSAGKIDLIFYPQIKLQSTWLDKIYATAINIAPAVEVSLWKGAYFTGQIILPLWHNLDGEYKYIRAGFLTFRQEYRFPKNLFASVSIGNFNMNRIGIDANIAYRPDNDRWMISLNSGLTGASTFYSGKWEVSSWKRFTGAVSFRYNAPIYDLQFDITAKRYVYGDNGIRFDCSRHFGEVTIGLFAMYTGGEPNGGFNFSVPLPRKKRAKRHSIRVGVPDYFDWEYEAQSGNNYLLKRLGQYYEIRPDENRSQRYYNPDHVKKSIIQLANESRD